MPLPEEVKEARRKYDRECEDAWADFDAEEQKRIERIKAARVELERVLYARTYARTNPSEESP